MSSSSQMAFAVHSPGLSQASTHIAKAAAPSKPPRGTAGSAISRISQPVLSPSLLLPFLLLPAHWFLHPQGLPSAKLIACLLYQRCSPAGVAVCTRVSWQAPPVFLCLTCSPKFLNCEYLLKTTQEKLVSLRDNTKVCTVEGAEG